MLNYALCEEMKNEEKHKEMLKIQKGGEKILIIYRTKRAGQGERREMGSILVFSFRKSGFFFFQFEG